MGQSEIRGIGQETGQETGARSQPLLTGNGQKIEDEDDRRRREVCFSDS